MQKILVTGAAGFIGSHLVDLLLSKGYQVVGLDNFQSGQMKNLAEAQKNSHFSFVEGDIRDEHLLQKIMQNVYAVYHQAAIVSVPLCSESPDVAVSVNMDGFSKVLMAAVKNKVERFFYASSCAVYGDQGEIAIAEEAPLCPMSLYAVSKETNEKIAFCVAKDFGIITHGMRYFNVYGKRQDPKGPYAGVIAKFIDLANASQRPTIWGSGLQTRDFVHVSDLVYVLVSMLNLIPDQAKEYKALNIASGSSRSVLDLWNIVLNAKKLSSVTTWTSPDFKNQELMTLFIQELT
jgi:UDP-N-acetylglucosamine 4-epimerase